MVTLRQARTSVLRHRLGSRQAHVPPRAQVPAPPPPPRRLLRPSTACRPTCSGAHRTPSCRPSRASCSTRYRLTWGCPCALRGALRGMPLCKMHDILLGALQGTLVHSRPTTRSTSQQPSQALALPLALLQTQLGRRTDSPHRSHTHSPSATPPSPYTPDLTPTLPVRSDPSQRGSAAAPPRIPHPRPPPPSPRCGPRLWVGTSVIQPVVGTSDIWLVEDSWCGPSVPRFRPRARSQPQPPPPPRRMHQTQLRVPRRLRPWRPARRWTTHLPSAWTTRVPRGWTLLS